jgi:hypothetical protein
MTKSLATCWKAGRFILVIAKDLRPGQDNAAEASSSRHAATFVSLATSYRFCGDQETQ